METGLILLAVLALAVYWKNGTSGNTQQVGIRNDGTIGGRTDTEGDTSITDGTPDQQVGVTIEQLITQAKNQWLNGDATLIHNLLSDPNIELTAAQQAELEALINGDTTNVTIENVAENPFDTMGETQNINHPIPYYIDAYNYYAERSKGSNTNPRMKIVSHTVFGNGNIQYTYENGETWTVDQYYFVNMLLAAVVQMAVLQNDTSHYITI